MSIFDTFFHYNKSGIEDSPEAFSVGTTDLYSNVFFFVSGICEHGLDQILHEKTNMLGDRASRYRCQLINISVVPSR